jgi:hypothetical protein
MGALFLNFRRLRRGVLLLILSQFVATLTAQDWFRGPILDLACAPDAREVFLVIPSNIVVLDAATLTFSRSFSTMEGVEDPRRMPAAASVTADGNLLLTRRFVLRPYKPLKLWNTKTMRGLRSFGEKGVSHATIAPRTANLACGIGDHIICWDTDTGNKRWELSTWNYVALKEAGFSSGVRLQSIRFSQDGSRLAVATHEWIGGILLFQTKTGKVLEKYMFLHDRIFCAVPCGKKNGVMALALHDDGNCYGISIQDGVVRRSNPFTVPASQTYVRPFFDISPDGKKMLMCGESKLVVLDSDLVHFHEFPVPAEIHIAKWLGDTKILTANYHAVTLLDQANGKPLATCSAAH